MVSSFSSSDRVLLVRSAWIGDFIVCIPFIEHLVTQVGIPRENIGFIIFNGQKADPVKAILGENGFLAKNRRTIAPTVGSLLSSTMDLRNLSAAFNRICYLPFQSEQAASIRKKKWAFMAAFGMGRTIEGMHGFESSAIRASQYLSLLDLYRFPQREVDYLAFLGLDEKECTAPDTMLAAMKPGLKVAVYPNSKLDMKTWPAEKYVALIGWLRHHYDATICLVGSREDFAYNNRILEALGDPSVVNAAGQFTIRETVRFLAGVDLLIGNDGAPLHMGALAKTPIVGLYGCKAPLGMWDPVLSPRVVTLQRDVACRLCFRSECPDPICVRGLTLEDVTEAVRLFLGGELPNGSYLLDGPFDPVRHRHNLFYPS